MEKICEYALTGEDLKGKYIVSPFLVYCKILSSYSKFGIVCSPASSNLIRKLGKSGKCQIYETEEKAERFAEKSELQENLKYDSEKFFKEIARMRKEIIPSINL